MPDFSADGAPTVSERLRRGDLFAEGCPSREVMRHVTSSWGVLILIALQDGTLRFSALRRRVAGVSERMLSQTLRWLEGDGLVERRSYPVVPPHTEYRLTELGREAAEKVAALADWIEDRLPAMRSVTPGPSTRRRPEAGRDRPTVDRADVPGRPSVGRMVPKGSKEPDDQSRTAVRK